MIETKLKLVKVQNIQDAHRDNIPMYSRDMLYKLKWIFALGNGRYEVTLFKIGVHKYEEYGSRVEIICNREGKVLDQQTNYHLDVFADADSIEYCAKYGGVPSIHINDNELSRDEYLRRAMYPRYSEHVMD